MGRDNFFSSMRPPHTGLGTEWVLWGARGWAESVLGPRVTHYPAGEETVIYYLAIAEISWCGISLQCHLNWGSPEADAEAASTTV